MFDIENFLKCKEEGLYHQQGAIQQFIEAYLAGQLSNEALDKWITLVIEEGLSYKELLELSDVMIANQNVLTLDNHPPQVSLSTIGIYGQKMNLAVASILGALQYTTLFVESDYKHTRQFSGLDLIKQAFQKEAFITNEVESNLIYCTNFKENDLLKNLKSKFENSEHTGLVAVSSLNNLYMANTDYFLVTIPVVKNTLFSDIETALELKMILADLAKRHNKRIGIVCFDGNQLLGNAFGNSMEVLEIAEFLKGNHKADNLLDGVSTLTSLGLSLLKEEDYSYDENHDLVEQVLVSQKAYHVFNDSLIRNDLNIEFLEHQEAEFTCDFYSFSNGVLSEIEIKTYIESSNKLGASFISQHEDLSSTAGIYLNKSLGDKVFVGENIARLYYNIERADYLDEVLIELDKATKVNEFSDSDKKFILDISIG